MDWLDNKRAAKGNTISTTKLPQRYVVLNDGQCACNRTLYIESSEGVIDYLVFLDPILCWYKQYEGCNCMTSVLILQVKYTNK